MQTIHWLTPHANIVTDESGWSPSLDAASYACGWSPPNYPVPAMIGEVHFDYWPRVLNLVECLEIIITDCDESADPRLYLYVEGSQVFTDYPHDSPNYR